MVATSTVMGAFAGLFVATYSNVVRKLPAFRQPWQHAGLICAGAYGFNQLEAFEERVRAAPIHDQRFHPHVTARTSVPRRGHAIRCRSRVFSLPSPNAAVLKPARRGGCFSFVSTPRTCPYTLYALLGKNPIRLILQELLMDLTEVDGAAGGGGAQGYTSKARGLCEKVQGARELTRRSSIIETPPL